MQIQSAAAPVKLFSVSFQIYVGERSNSPEVPRTQMCICVSGFACLKGSTSIC